MSVRCLAIRQGQVTSPAVAMLQWDGEQPKVRFLHAAAEPQLRQYLHAALSKPPFRSRRRKRSGDGIIEITAETVTSQDADFLGRWAAKLTFSPHNNHNFIFTAANEADAASLTHLNDAESASDLFELGGTFRSSYIACPCGGQYPFLAVQCPKCGGTDPIGSLWAQHGSVVVQALDDFTFQRLASKSSFQNSFQPTKGAFEAAVRAQRDSALTPLETDDEATTARKLLSYYKGVFRHGCLNEKAIAELKAVPNREFTCIVNELRGAARGLRTLWKSDCTVGWNPNEMFVRRCRADILSVGEPGMETAAHTAQRMIKVAAQFGPFHSEFKRRVAASEDDLKTLLKGAWRVFKAVKTLGASELIGGVLSVMKDQKFKERFDRFSRAFDNAVAGCVSAQNAIDRSLSLHRDLLARLAKGMRYHIIMVLAEDYAAASHDEQVQIANCLAKAAGCPALKHYPLQDRGLDAQRRRRLVLAWCIGTSVILFLAFVFLVAFLTKH
jgi:hypothetical protein